MTKSIQNYLNSLKTKFNILWIRIPWGENVHTDSTVAHPTTHPPVQCVRGFFPGGKAAEAWSKPLTPSSVNVKNKCGYTSVDMENFTSFLPFTETSCSYLTENTVCSIIKTSRWCRTGIQWLLVGRIMWNSLINRGQNPNVLVWRYVWSLGCES